jgi:membrane-bound serine protease (ClpP class)
VSTVGLVLLVVAAALAVAEAHMASGALGAGAVIALAAGLALIVAGAGAQLAVAIGVAVGVGIVGAAAAAVLARQVLTVRRAPVRGGAAGLIGRRGEVRAPPTPIGNVLVDGALWRARLWAAADEEDETLNPGDVVVVEGVDGLTLSIRRAEEWEVMT